MQILTKDWSYYQWVRGVGEIRVLSPHSIWSLSLWYDFVLSCFGPLFLPLAKWEARFQSWWSELTQIHWIHFYLFCSSLRDTDQTRMSDEWVCPLSSLQEIDGSTRGLTLGDWMKVYLQKCEQVSRNYGMVKSPGTRFYHFYSLKGGTSKRYRHERGVAWQGGKQWIPWPSLPSPQILAGVFHGLNIIGTPETRQFR